MKRLLLLIAVLLLTIGGAILAVRRAHEGLTAQVPGGPTPPAPPAAAPAPPPAPIPVCNAIPMRGSSVKSTRAKGAPPSLAGGTPLSGTYALTKVTVFDAPPGELGSTQMTLELSMKGTSGEMELVDGSGRPGSRKTVAIAFSGAGATLTQTCPVCSNEAGCVTGTAPYSFSGGKLTLVPPMSQKKPVEMYTFTKLR